MPLGPKLGFGVQRKALQISGSQAQLGNQIKKGFCYEQAVEMFELRPAQ
jgi:hypothetical protein